MQILGPKAYLVLEKIFKCFYHIWAWQPSWSMDHDHFSNLSFPCPKEAPYEIWATLAQRLQNRSHLKLSTFFPYKCMGHINKCIRKQTWPHCKKLNWLCWRLTTRQPLWVILCCLPEKERREIEEILEEILFVLRFYGPVNPMGSCRVRSVYLTTCLLGRLSPLSG